MFTKYTLFVLCCLMLLMKFKEASLSNDTGLTIEVPETEKFVTNMTSLSTTSNHKSRIVEKEKISSEGQIKKNKKPNTTGISSSITTPNQISNSTKTVVTSSINEENKSIEQEKSMKSTEPKMKEMKKSEEHQENKSMKPTEPKNSEENKSVERQDNTSKDSGNSNTGINKKSEEQQENKPMEPKNSEENKSVERQDGKSKDSGNSNTGVNKKSEEQQENKSIKSTEHNTDVKKNSREQLDGESKEITKSKADEKQKTEQSQTNINEKMIGSRTSTQSISGSDKSDDNKNTADLNDPKLEILRKKSNELSKNNNINQSDIIESSNSHFMVIIFIGLLFTIVAYVVFQKRKKIIAYVIEGRRRNSRDRRASGSKDTKVSYKPLDTEDKEAGINNYKYVY